MCDSGRDTKKIPCVIERRPATGNDSCTWSLSGIDISDLFDGAEPGEIVTLEYCEMTQEELDAMPEFEGW
jgi:hypothetical protein